MIFVPSLALVPLFRCFSASFQPILNEPKVLCRTHYESHASPMECTLHRARSFSESEAQRSDSEMVYLALQAPLLKSEHSIFCPSTSHNH